jgi:hypothetical protein
VTSTADRLAARAFSPEALVPGDGRPLVTLADALAVLEDEGGPAPVSWSATSVGEWPTTNALKGRNHHVIAKAISPIRDAFELLASGRAGTPKAPRFEHAGLVVQAEWWARPRAKIPDPAAPYLAAKAALDGLVRAGVLPDDNSTRLTGGELYLPVIRSHRFALTLTLTETAPCPLPPAPSTTTTSRPARIAGRTSKSRSPRAPSGAGPAS